MTELSKGLISSVFIFGCGYVGTALAERLLSQGVRVGALTRNANKAQLLRELGVHEVIVADLDSSSWHSEVSGRYAGIVNCVSSAGGGLPGYRKSYIEGQRSILRWIAGSKTCRYIYTSSTSVYPQDGGISVDENSSTENAPATGQVLVESEQILSDFCEKIEHWYVFRLAGIYGPNRHYLLDQLRTGGSVIPGRGDYTLNMIHLEDIVEILVKALRVDTIAGSGIYNLVDSEPTHKEEVLTWLASALGVPKPSFDPSEIPPRLKRRGGRMPDRIIRNERVCASFSWEPKFPSFRDGYAALVGG